MAMFAKKENWEHKVAAEVGTGPALTPAAAKAGSPKYGIAEAIQLMRTLPTDQGVELVVRVVRATLASLDVRLPDIIEDASRKQKAVRDRIADFHAKNAELREAARGAPQGDRGAGGRPEGDDRRQGPAAAGRGVLGAAGARRTRRPQAAHDHAARHVGAEGRYATRPGP